MLLEDEQHLRRAIRLAMNGRGRVEPNPMVGSVLVKEGRIIGEGYHARFGGPHAEPAAINSCNQSPAGATAYVTLEPCCHTNKQTPPCVPRLIKAGIVRVVVGCLDPNPEVNGNGIRQLRDAGIVVDGPLLEAESRQLIAPFLARVKFHRPYITLKWAQSADGKIAGPGGARRQIGNELSTKFVHELRSRSDAIAVGIGTVLTDDPELTARNVDAVRVPFRIVLDSSLKIPITSKLVQTAAMWPTSVYCANLSDDREALLSGLNVSVVKTEADNSGRLRLLPVLTSLTDVTHLLVEAGPTLARSFFLDDVVDRLWIFRSPTKIDDDTAPAAATIPNHFVKTGDVELEGDVLTEYLNTRSTVYADVAESADLWMTRNQVRGIQ